MGAVLRTDARTVPTIAATTEAKDMHAIEPEIGSVTDSDDDDLRKWIPAIEGFVDDTMSSYLPLSKKIKRNIYCYNEENNAVLYQANHLVYPSEITRLEQDKHFIIISEITLGCV